MPTIRRLATVWFLAIVALAAIIAVNGFDGPRPAVGIIPLPTPPPLGVALVVKTTSDSIDPGDGTCSLRAAILATNLNGHAGNCDASLSEPGGTDGIYFNIGTGTPVINVGATPLPAIKDKLSIDGNGHGATRVELHGPGAGSGLTISGSSAGGSSIRNLVINNFSNGINLATTTSITIVGDYIGTNSAGGAAVPNSTGISMTSSTATIGGLTGLTPGGAHRRL